MKKELIQNILADDKGSEVFFETVMQEKVEELKELRKKDIARKLLTESAPDQTELAIETIQKFIKQKRAMGPDDLQKLLRFVPKGGSKRRELGRDSIQTAVTRKRALKPDDLKKLSNMLTEDYVVEVTTKDGETFRTGKMKTEKEADKKHWKLAKGNKYKSVKVVKEEEEDLEESDQRINLNKNKQTIQDLEKLGVKNVYRKHPLPIQREKMLRDAANAGLIKLK